MIENSNFILKDIPDFNPIDRERDPWWQEQRRRLFDGYWVGGKWMPPNLYQYVNFWHILLSKDEYSKSKSKGRPLLRDLEWFKSYIYQEAKGFSGFELDDKYTCHRALAPENKEFAQILFPKEWEKYKDRKYIPAREYLNTVWGRSDMGRPLYENQASNVIDIESRGGGKSFYAANNIGHNFLTDGATSYQQWLSTNERDEEVMSETMVGAYDSKWSGDLLAKVKFGLDNIPGGKMFQGRWYPTPHSKKYKGSFGEGKNIIAEYKTKRGDSWVDDGSKSKVFHRTYRNNPFAGNGTRSNQVYLEEVGFMKNLTEAFNALRDAVYDGDIKFAMIWAMGTGGDMEGGGTASAKKVFYNPKSFECLEFIDIYENTGMIGLFVPAHMTLNRHRNSEGIINAETAKKAIELERADKRKNDRDSYNSVVVNRCETPSEAFRMDHGNVFPTADLEELLKYLEGHQDDLKVRGDYGEFILDSNGKSKFVNDTKGKLQPAGFPIERGKQEEGCVVIWEHPPENEEIPYGRYIAATDPYDQDRAPNTTSVGSTLILKTLDPTNPATSFSVVAEYSGRPRFAKQHHETVRRLLMYYNARTLFENERNTIKMHFENERSMHLLLDSPTIQSTKASSATSIARGNKGHHMTDELKNDMEFYLRDFLQEKGMDGKMHLWRIKSIPVVKELLEYNKDGNFDRVIAFLFLILHLEQIRFLFRKQATEKKKDDFFEHRRKAHMNMVERMVRDIDDIETPKETFVHQNIQGKKKTLLPGMFPKGSGLGMN